MTNDFDDVYWMLDTGFRPMVAENRQYYIYIYNHQCLCVTKLNENETRDNVTDQYRCSLSKSIRTTEAVCSDPYHINSLKEWITTTGQTPKKAAIRAINMALADPIVKGHSDLRYLKLTFNPIVKFILDCLNYFTIKH